MEYSGNIRKMRTVLHDPVAYQLPVGEHLLDVNACLGRAMEIHHAGKIHCIACGRQTKKSFNQGYCYPCMQSLAECDMCIVRPELCHFAAGTCRDAPWALQHCMQDHVVYVANSSGLKVGITRHSQLPTRWMDQGATQALPIFQVNNRHLSGLVEMALKKYMSDRTDWRAMLKGESAPLALAELAKLAIQAAATDIEKIRAQYGEDSVKPVAADMLSIHYPVMQYPTKVTSFNLDKLPEIQGRLLGIKGQYLIFDTGVINMRKYAGYQLTLRFYPPM